MVVGDRAAADRLSHGAAGARPHRPDAGRTRYGDLVRNQAAREFRLGDELRHLPDVLCLVGALSVVVRARGKPAALLGLRAQPVHSRGRAHPLRALWSAQLAGARRRGRLHGGLHDRRHPGLRSGARVHRPPGPGRRRRMGFLLILVRAVGLASSARAADPPTPDGPCVQVRGRELPVAAMWAGPPIDDVGRTWEDDPKVKDLVARLAARRLPLEEAQRVATDFLAGSGDAKQAQGKLLFAGLFATLDRLRSEVITGIERYTRRQR